MKKRIITIALAAVMAASLVTGCQKGGQASNDNLTIEGYENIEIDEIASPEVTDEEVDAYINSVLVGYSPQQVQVGDTVYLSYEGRIDGELFDGGSSAGTDLEIGSNTFIAGFEDSVVGHVAGDTYDWNGRFPDDYGIEYLQGKDVVFTITVLYIEGTPELPELTDELVQQISEVSKTPEDYREEVRKQLEESKKSDYDAQLQSAAWDAVLAKAEIKEYPEERLQEYMDLLMEQYKSYADASGMSLEEMLEAYYQMSYADFENEVRSAAEESIKQELVAETIAEKEGLVPSEKEYKEAIEKLAEEYGYESVDSLKEIADDDTLKSIVLQNIVREYLAKNAVQKK